MIRFCAHCSWRLNTFNCLARLRILVHGIYFLANFPNIDDRRAKLECPDHASCRPYARQYTWLFTGQLRRPSPSFGHSRTFPDSRIDCRTVLCQYHSSDSSHSLGRRRHSFVFRFGEILCADRDFFTYQVCNCNPWISFLNLPNLWTWIRTHAPCPECSVTIHAFQVNAFSKKE